MNLVEFDLEVKALDKLFDNGAITQKEWSLQYEFLKDQYNASTPYEGTIS